MKVYVDRAAVLEILSANGSLHNAKKLVEELPVITVSEDGKTVFHSYGKNTKIIENVGTLFLN